MKKFSLIFLASFLVLAACGNKEETKSDEKEETKSSNKEDKKSNDDRKSNKSNSDDESNEQVATQDATAQTQEQAPIVEEQTVHQEQTTQQAPVNSARLQALDEGIDFDNPTDAEIERMRELSKQSPYGMQEPTQAGPME
ncbi:hypothetical protein HYE69_06960 [Staphylococcus sp. GSSP0090]|nr:hypothetical protein [Staphylococcus sp. GSSP0090]